jgi:hypothetical protein
MFEGMFQPMHLLVIFGLALVISRSKALLSNCSTTRSGGTRSCVGVPPSVGHFPRTTDRGILLYRIARSTNFRKILDLCLQGTSLIV